MILAEAVSIAALTAMVIDMGLIHLRTWISRQRPTRREAITYPRYP